ncbi:hypothetical protein [uncultured Hyphomicrobium sp.]|uniref:hypothetical protein n=1 Tax=uncultured Hyphomicrobium sp. TaxID=194373 RepID=UPI0025FBC10B|nr:hypothetical protein [uncultured Hyphomicrobium sp.]
MDSDLDAILELQDAYGKAVIAQGRLPPEIEGKLERYCLLLERKASECADATVSRELFELAIELLPHLCFKMDSVNWREQ